MLPFFEWCEATALGQLVRDSLWLFPVIEAVHLLGLCALGGSLLVVRTCACSVSGSGENPSRSLRATIDHGSPAAWPCVPDGHPAVPVRGVKCYHNRRSG